MSLRFLLWLALGTLAVPTAADSTDRDPLAERCRAEIVELHDWIEAWSNAELPDDDEAFARFSVALDPTFVIVGPDGKAGARDTVLGAVRGSHGRWASEPGQIRIENVQLLQSGGGFALATYEEWHELGTTRGRVSTVLFGEREDAPNGLVWLHLHETWIPTSDSP